MHGLGEIAFLPCSSWGSCPAHCGHGDAQHHPPPSPLVLEQFGQGLPQGLCTCGSGCWCSSPNTLALKEPLTPAAPGPSPQRQRPPRFLSVLDFSPTQSPLCDKLGVTLLFFACVLHWRWEVGIWVLLPLVVAQVCRMAPGTK